MVNEPGTGPGFFSGSARATEASSAHSASGTKRSARLTREADLTWMLMGAELPTRPGHSCDRYDSVVAPTPRDGIGSGLSSPIPTRRPQESPKIGRAHV